MHPIEAILDYCQRAGIGAINALPGCLEVDVDGRWWFAANGHGEPTACSDGALVEPYHFYVKFNGWPAAVFDATGEGLFPVGAAANAAAFVAALRGKAVTR